MNSRQQTFLWRQITSLRCALIIHTSVRRWLRVNPIRPARCGQHPVTWARLAAHLMADCFFSLSPSNMWLRSCVSVFLCLTSAVMSRCSVSAVFSDMRYAIACARVRMCSHVPCPAFTFFCFSFFPLLSCSIVSTAWAHCVSLTYVPSVTRQPANLPRQGTINTPYGKVPVFQRTKRGHVL